MIERPVCLLYSHDPEWVRRMQSHLQPVTDLRVLDTPEALAFAMDAGEANVLLLDLFSDGVAGNVADVRHNWPHAIVLAFGTPGSDPYAEALASDAYAADDRDADSHRLRGLVRRALDHLRLREDNALLRRQSDQSEAMISALRTINAGAKEDDLLTVRHLPGALRHVDDAGALLQGLVEDVARTLRVSRVGIFYRQSESDVYRLHAGMCCLEGTRDLTYTARDPLVLWMLLHAHVVTRDNLELGSGDEARNLLRHILERLGAELLVPLQSRERLHGWMFLGHRATGLPFEPAHMENLAMVAEHIATALENASLYGEVAVQKTLAETLLQTMPVGIVAVDVQGFVRGFNPPAVALLNQPAEEVMRRPVDQLDSRVADALRGALAGNADGEPREWTSTLGHQLEVRVRRLMNEGACLGAMLMLRDVTVERQLGERQSNLERATFWNELAAAMAHEIRNPLVAIRTFAQLLPERYQEVEFRNEFHTLVTSEVDRLNGIVEQINGFAHPPAMEFKRLDPVPLLRRAADALGLGGEGAAIKLVWRLESGLLQVWGDERALADTFAHLLRNACEALQGKPPASGGVITVHARRKGRAMLVTIGDNGPGIDPCVRDRIQSPFCTTKPRGLGLGLSIARRTMVDHAGQMDIASGSNGVEVTLTLPEAAATAATNGTV